MQMSTPDLIEVLKSLVERLGGCTCSDCLELELETIKHKREQLKQTEPAQ